MIIAAIKEIKDQERRVGLSPACVRGYVADGHTVLIERGAGLGSGFSDEAYQLAGAQIVSKEQAFARASVIVKVKEPLPCEYELFRPHQLLYTYLHLAANADLARFLCERRISALAYETLEIDGKLPCLAPMSAIAGRLAVIAGCEYLQSSRGGKGLLLSGLSGVRKGRVVILGSGVVGLNAAQLAYGMGAQVSILGKNAARLEYIDHVFNGKITTLFSTEANIEEALADCDLLIGAALVPGAAAPKLVRRSHLGLMQPGSVIVDVAIDQGGCCETSRPTTHSEPVYTEGGIIHYAVANMPGACAHTSTVALVNATSAYGRKIFADGDDAAGGGCDGGAGAAVGVGSGGASAASADAAGGSGCDGGGGAAVGVGASADAAGGSADGQLQAANERVLKNLRAHNLYSALNTFDGQIIHPALKNLLSTC